MQWWHTLRLIGGSALIMGCCAKACASEYSLRTEPQSITATTFRERPVLQVSWGAVGGAIDRSGQDILSERERLLALARSPEALAWFREHYAVTRAQDRAAGQRRGEEAMLLYRSAAQRSGLMALEAATTRELPVPAFLRLPRDVLGTLSIGVIDAADPRQRAWAEALRRSHPHTQLFVVGWESLEAVDAWMEAAPVVAGAHVVAHVAHAALQLSPEAFTQRYHIHHLPAHMTFPQGTTMHLREGLAP